MNRIRGRVRDWLALASSFLLVACLTACGDGQGAGPASDGPIVLDESAVHILGRSDEIAIVRDLEVLPNGSVWVLNSSAPFFLGFGPDGASLGVHGEEGGGPFEFQLPAAFVTGDDDGEAWVFDVRRNALIRISDPGGDWSEIVIPRDEMPLGSLAGGMNMLASVVRTARLGDEIVLARTALPDDGGLIAFRMRVLRPDIMALDPTSGAVRRVVSLSDVMEDPTADLAQTEGGFPLWFRLWTTCSGDGIRIYDRVRDEIRVFTPDGSEATAIALPPADLSDMTAEQIAGAVFELRAAEVAGEVGYGMPPADSVRLFRELVAGIANERRQAAALLPRYVDLRCSSDESLWLRPLDPEEGGLNGGRSWLRIDPDGGVREVRLPNRFDALHFVDDRIWGVQRDEYDVASIAWIDFRMDAS